MLSDFVAVGSLPQEVVHLSPLIGSFLPTTHTRHTHTLWVSVSWNFCVLPQFDLILFFL